MTDITMIALSKLVESEDNVRRQGKAEGIGALAASIEAHGLLQSLVVRATGNGRYAVVAGGRRLRALRQLAKKGAFAKAVPIPCRIIAGGEDASELSLAENTIRTAMAPADEILAFAALAEKGAGPEEIGGRFGVSGTHVARRLRLARVSPKLIALLRKGEIDLDQMAALSVSDDHATQEAAFLEAPEWARTPERLKALVMQSHVPESDKLVRFVGIDAYASAGGAVVSDLLSEQGEGRWLADRGTLQRLAEAKLDPLVAETAAEGWGFVEIALDGIDWRRFPERIRQSRRELSDAEIAEQEALYARLDASEDEAEIAEIENAIDALARAAWGADEIALAGALVTLTGDGAPRIERGLVKLEDVKRLKALRRGTQRADAECSPQDMASARPAIPAKLMEELMAHKSWGLRLAFASDPELALRALVFTLAGVLIEQPVRATCLDVRIGETDLSRSLVHWASEGPSRYAALVSRWRKALPGDDAALWAHVAAMELPALLELLAVLIAPGVDLRSGQRHHDVGRTFSGEAFAEAAGLDMSTHWSATVESYFAHVRRDVVLDAMREAKPGSVGAKLEKASKKDVLAKAERVFKGSRWLPEPLRVAVPTRDAVEAIAAE